MKILDLLAKQKFHSGDTVWITEDLSRDHMSHFQSGVEAIVCYSYAQAHGGDDHDVYCLEINGYRVSWYWEHQLKLLSRYRREL